MYIVEVTSEWSLHNTCIFTVRHITASLHLGILDSTVLSGHFKQRNHQKQNEKKTQKCQKHGTKYIMKRKLVYSISWNKAEYGLVWPQLETFMLGDSNFLPLYACQWMMDCKSTTSADFGVTNFSQQVSLQVWNLKMMRIKCVTVLPGTPSLFL